MKTRTKKWISIAVATIVTTLLITGGFLLMKHNVTPTKQDYVAFLKEHEQEMTDKVKEKNSKVTSVQWDWDSVEVGEIGNGLPGGAGMALTVHGEFNQIENSSFYVQFNLDKNEDIAFKSMVVNPLRIGGRIFYE